MYLLASILLCILVFLPRFSCVCVILLSLEQSTLKKSKFLKEEICVGMHKTRLCTSPLGTKLLKVLEENNNGNKLRQQAEMLVTFFQKMPYTPEKVESCLKEQKKKDDKMFPCLDLFCH